ncbi:cTAGE family member 9 [Sciurus carolinensis]|uniref:CTAGE family member 9 n=1 Tax=Sciurus carolinensis TaxID=30640 RepID=A0AA41N9A5_SCICA|nr:cTAGE family member 9 [Sciurus carolinensis]
MEFKFKFLEEDPYALDVSNTAFGRERPLYGPLPLVQPSCEMRVFPLEKKGPLRLSPLYPGEGGGGSGGPEDPLDHQISIERRESSYDSVTDPYRAPADAGPLSSPQEPEGKRMIPPPGQPYSDPPSLLQRQDGYYYYSKYGRPSEPGEPSLIQCKMCSLRHFPPHPPPRAEFFPLLQILKGEVSSLQG